MNALYELTDGHVEIQRQIYDGVDAEVFTDTLQAIEESIEVKVEGYHAIIQNTKGDIEKIKTEEKRLADRRKAMENKVDKLKRNLEENMTKLGKRKITTPLFTAWIQPNTPSVRVLDEKLIPKEFWKEQDPKLDKTSLGKALKKSDTPGAEIVQTESIRFR
ncbi:siphovirus Gp157 family protein [Salicibibacter kimchii]|uniref:ATPase n=1 Tax=Salicibibacter kimchii TaxID=2099786 RepID=A0A345BUG2_9BACI|nr:siphovirus Gp157 family protein [Salicibibacter kimchii]AXF54593.1 ATPase [Salicibibacter kimchii]